MTPNLVKYTHGDKRKNYPHLKYCRVCQEKFTPGENIISKIRGKHGRSHYHIHCAKKVNLI